MIHIASLATRRARGMIVPPSLDADAQAYIDAVVAAGGTLSSAEEGAIDDWVVDGKANGWWAKLIDAWWWTHGAAAPNAVGVKGTTGVFSGGGWTHGATSANGNGSTDYFQTTINAEAHASLTIHQGGVAFYSETNSEGVYADIGASKGTPAPDVYLLVYARISGNGRFYWGQSSTGLVQGANTDSRGLFIGNRNGTTKELRRKTSSALTTIATATNTNTGALADYQIYGAALNNKGALTDPSARQYSFQCVHAGFSSAELEAFADATYTLLTALGVSVV